MPLLRYDTREALHVVATVDSHPTVLPYVTLIEPAALPSILKCPEIDTVEAGDEETVANVPSLATTAPKPNVAVSSPRHGAGNDT